jgi:transposase
VRADREDRLQGVRGQEVSANQMEIARLRSELSRVKMEHDVLEKAAAYFAKARQ